MALVNCSECSKKISSEAEKCPKCGAPVDLEKIKAKQQQGAKGCLIFFVIVFFIVLIVQISTKDKETIPTENIDTISFEAIDTVGQKAKMDSTKKAEEIANAKFLKTKAGKIKLRHPEWSKEDCISLSENKIWIGMEYEMLVYMRGKPNTTNTSDYGSGPEYQCCWDNYTPSCFYMNSDKIITAYN